MDYVNAVVSPYVELATDPVFKYFFWASTILALVCWILTIITDNYSQVDRLWSILPPVYALGFLGVAIQQDRHESNWPAFSRLVLMTALPSIWGARLTYNFWRKDGYNMSTEDYRWVHVRRMFDYPRRRLAWHLFNFFFTALLQNYLLLGLVVPMWRSLASRHPLSQLDVALGCAFLLFLLVEIVADQQQWNFQTKKYAWLSSTKRTTRAEEKSSSAEIDAYRRGFLVRGLFAYSRHPNFFAEISIWWTYYLFSVSSQLSPSSFSLGSFNPASLVNYSALAVFVLTLLFHGSTNLTERITSEKYPEYRKYQRHVSRIIPFFGTYNPDK